MLTYEAARDALVTHLRQDAAAPELGRLRVALAFWDGWIDTNACRTWRRACAPG